MAEAIQRVSWLAQTISELDSEAKATILGGIAGGVVGGVLAVLGAIGGFALQRWSQKWGRVRCEIDELDRAMYRWAGTPDDPLVAVESLDELGSSDELIVDYSFIIKFFNEKDRASGLTDISVAFVDEKDREHLIDITGANYPGPGAVVNLPSQR